eukprot:979650-Pleurochrysis_carterae.AAC.1
MPNLPRQGGGNVVRVPLVLPHVHHGHAGVEDDYDDQRQKGDQLPLRRQGDVLIDVCEALVEEDGHAVDVVGRQDGEQHLVGRVDVLRLTADLGLLALCAALVRRHVLGLLEIPAALRALVLTVHVLDVDSRPLSRWGGGCCVCSSTVHALAPGSLAAGNAAVPTWNKFKISGGIEELVQ